MKNNQKFSTLVWLNKPKEKEGRFPLYIRINVDGRKAAIATRHYINPKQWDSRLSRLKLNAPNSAVINAYIDRALNNIQQEFLKCAAIGKMTTSKELKDSFLGIEPKTQEKTFLEVIEYHNLKMEELVKVDRVVKSTWGKYLITKKKVATFLKEKYNVNDLQLSEVGFKFITDFEHYMLTTQKLHTNTAHKNIKNLKKIMRMCVDLEWIDVNPFTRFRCSYKTPERVVLTLEEIQTLLQTEFVNNALNEVRDVFVFCCYTGFAYAEVYKFERNDLSIGIDSEYWLTTYRKKTGERESVPLLPVALEIVRKYEKHKLCNKNNKLLPVRTNQLFNNYLKEVAAFCRINKRLTTHIARHTFATTVTLSNGVPIETVSKMLGHSRLATTQIYAKVLDQKVSNDMQILKAKLNPPTQIEKQKKTS